MQDWLVSNMTKNTKIKKNVDKFIPLLNEDIVSNLVINNYTDKSLLDIVTSNKIGEQILINIVKANVGKKKTLVSSKELY